MYVWMCEYIHQSSSNAIELRIYSFVKIECRKLLIYVDYAGPNWIRWISIKNKIIVSIIQFKVVMSIAFVLIAIYSFLLNRIHSPLRAL